MKIMGLVTYIAHKWRDRMFLKKKRGCKHPHECPCDIKLLQERKLDRPFLTNPIRRPIKIDNKIEEQSARDTETLIKVGLHVCTIICADHVSNPTVPRNMTNFTISKMRLNQAFCMAYSGKLLRYNAVVKPA